MKTIQDIDKLLAEAEAEAERDAMTKKYPLDHLEIRTANRLCKHIKFLRDIKTYMQLAVCTIENLEAQKQDIVIKMNCNMRVPRKRNGQLEDGWSLPYSQEALRSQLRTIEFILG